MKPIHQFVINIYSSILQKKLKKKKLCLKMINDNP